LNLPHLYLVPPLVVARWNFAEIFGIGKLESWAIVYGVVCVILSLAVLVCVKRLSGVV